MIVLIASALTACGQGILTFSELRSNEQLFSTGAVEAIVGRRTGQESVVWPDETSVTFVARKSIPRDVVEESGTWIERIVKLPLPPAYENRFMGLRGKQFDDVVALRYASRDSRVQIMDHPLILTVTIKCPAYTFGSRVKDNDEMARSVIEEAFRIPNGKLDRAVLHSSITKGVNGVELYGASVEIEVGEKSVEWLSWWNRFWFTANESTISFTFRKTLGDGKFGTEKGPVSTRPPGRFGKID